MGKILLMLALVLAGLGSDRARAQAEMNQIFWEMCPYILGFGVEALVVRLRLRLDPEDVGPAFDILCRVGKYYDQPHDQPKEKLFTPAQSQQVREYLCRTQDLKYCSQPTEPTPPAVTVAPQSEADKRAQKLVEQCRQRKLAKADCLIGFADSPEMGKE